MREDGEGFLEVGADIQEDVGDMQKEVEDPTSLTPSPSKNCGGHPP